MSGVSLVPDNNQEEGTNVQTRENRGRNVLDVDLRTIILAVTVAASVAALHAFLPAATRAAGEVVASSTGVSLGKSSLGQLVAIWLRRSGWPDQAVVFLLAMLPVLELRGAIPVGYWMDISPITTSCLAILGNMVPVPLILLYLGPLSAFLASRSHLAARAFDWLFTHTRKKAGPIAEFRWLGLMLFVAVPLPGTGAWSGAIAAHLLGMPLWDALGANFFGVVIAALILNALCSLGPVQAIAAGAILFVLSAFVWSILRWVRSTSVPVDDTK